MIAIQNEHGELIKIISHVVDGHFGLHRSYGIISKGRAQARNFSKKLNHCDFIQSNWLCTFRVLAQGNNLQIIPESNCELNENQSGKFLSTPHGIFNFSSTLNADIPPLLEDHEDRAKWLTHLTPMTFLFILAFIPILYFYNGQKTKTSSLKPEIINEVIDSPVEPVKIKMVQAQMPVTVTPMMNETTPTNQEVLKAKVVHSNLGFLNLKSSIKVGDNIPTQLKNVESSSMGTGENRGVGMGTGHGVGNGSENGHAKMGGELLSGFGKGIRRASAGFHSGVQGLGGIATKGNGGGNGGYGKGLLASGEGKGISSIAVSKSDLVLEGGISRYAINATIAKYLNQVRRCYESELKNLPELQGMVEMDFEINAEGKLNFSKVNKSTLNNSNVENCISTKMMDWQFPKPKGGVNVSVKYPFILRPVGV